MEQYLRGVARNNGGGVEPPCQSLKSLTSTLDESEANPSVGFECNICLDLVQDPVVTLCGHLYCWPCIYRWISFQHASPENPDNQKPQCPVCKSEVSEKTVIPLYGRGQSTEASKTALAHPIPQRPPSPRCRPNLILPNVAAAANYAYPFEQLHRRGYGYDAPPSPRPDYGSYPASPGGGAPHLADPMIGVFGEMVYSRIFGNSETTTAATYAYPNSYQVAGVSSPRLRRHMVQTDKSLSRVCFFLLCCVMLCLLLF